MTEKCARTLIAFCAIFSPVILSAQSLSPECAAVFTASQKMFTTPNHQYLTRTSAGKTQKTENLETITVIDAMYIKMNGRWIKSPVAPSARLKDRATTTLKDATCRRLRDESVSGVAATVYRVHSKTADDTSAGQYWVARSTGLLLRSEVDLAVDGEKSHSAMRAEFVGVTAPR
ncbi:MAG: hypothetical protein ABJC26_15370 [Gemmatimonadaceae bacterium]